MFSAKYYRKLRRLDSKKAERYRISHDIPPIKSKEVKITSIKARKSTLDTHWAKTQDRWILHSYDSPSPVELQELSKKGYYEGYIFNEKPDFDKIGKFEVIYDPREIEVDGYYISMGYWLYLSNKIEKLKQEDNALELYNLQQTMPVDLRTFRLANKKLVISQLLGEEESDFEAENL